MTQTVDAAAPQTAAKPALTDWAGLSRDYARYHATLGNQRCHAVGIPLIVFAVVSWTLWPGTRIPVAAAALPIYFLWSPALGLAMTAVVAGMSAAAPLCPRGAALAAFVVGWLFQLAGHKFYEGKSPAFTDNLTHLLVGPAWVLKKFLRLPG